MPKQKKWVIAAHVDQTIARQAKLIAALEDTTVSEIARAGVEREVRARIQTLLERGEWKADVEQTLIGAE